MRRLLVVAAMLAVVAGGCASAAEELTEQIAENAAGVDNLEVDTESGEVSFDTDDGSVSIGGGDLPEGLPFQPPSGGDVVMSLVSDETIAVQLTYDIDRYDELDAAVTSYTDSADDEYARSDSTFDFGDGNMGRSSLWVSDDWAFTLGDCFSLASDGDSFDSACLTLTTTN